MEREQRKISIRLNGKEQNVHEFYDEIVAARDETSESDREFVPQPDKVINFNAIQEERKKRGQPFWDDGNREKAPKIPYKRKKKTRNYEAKRSFPTMLVMAIFSAIIVGISFGFMVLTVFTGGDQQSIEAGSTTASTIPAFGDGAVGLPTLAVDVVQGGAFSSQEKGELIASNIHKKGLAAVLTKSTDPIYMFIGIGGDRAQSTAISKLYEGYNQETYLKSYRVEGITIEDIETDVTNWFFDASHSFKEMMQLSVDGLTRDGAIITDNQVNVIEEQLSLLQGKRDRAFSTLPSSGQPHALAMGDALVKAGQGLENYVQTEDKQQLWVTQQELLHALVNYELLLSEWE
ncbi:hypothetical protein [Bacillus solitudinis]|uniref:hypothetical protein n=1 Tax=Bacillus solitudinis TaxID=2014074 RepID=UPI000C231645|nr:hypothetical protein [Bacillus solitudinis]